MTADLAARGETPSGEFVWTVPTDHPAFAGHFPGRPIVPGVLLLDEALRCAGKWLEKPVDRWTVAQAKFLSPVGPGETLHIRLNATPRGNVDFRIAAGERAVASGSLTPLGTAAT